MELGEIKYGKEIEDRIKKITALLKRVQINYPVRYITIKLLEDDEEIKKMVESADPKIMTIVEKYARELERIHGHTVRFIIASERYNVANRLTQHSIRQIPTKIMFSERLDKITLHKVFGYPIMVIIILTIFLIIFKFGSFISGILENFFSNIELTFQSLFGTSVFTKLILGGVLNGLFAGIAIVIPYILPFYFILGLLEDSGYLTRIAFLVDTLMHKIGLHGKAFIPLMLGYGCNVPACLGCKIMETRKERFLAVFLTTLIPCAARTVIILGLVGAFVGMKWALALYIFNLIIIFVLGRLTFKILPGEPMGLIMEMHDYKIPHLKTIIKQTWFRLKEFIIIAFPFIIVGSFIIKILEITNLLEPISNAMSPITVWWLGLPAITGITLIFGILRKELILIMLATLLGTTNFALALTPVQMMVFAIVSMLYIPCIATIAVLVKELKWKKALYITVFEIAFAIFIGGLAYRVLSIVM